MDRLVYLFLTVVFISFVIPAFAESSKVNAIGIIIEKSCLMSDNCIKYRDLVGLDNSPKTVGIFKEKGDDVFRYSTPKQDNFEWLRFQKNSPVIIVDPPGKIATRIKIITIVSSLDEFHMQGQDKIVELKTGDAKATQKIRTFSHTRDVDSRCHEATITAKNWQIVLSDTINYLNSGCSPDSTKLQTITNEITTLQKQDLKTSYKWKDQQWRDQILKNCIKSRNACTELNQPTRGGL